MRRAAGASVPSTSGVSVGHHELPAAHLEREDVAEPPGRGSRPPATTATRLQSASASARMCELKNTVRP